MIYLSGCIHRGLYGLPGIGYMLSRYMGNRPDLTQNAWGADHGTFRRPERFDADDYLRWLDRLEEYRETCLFATAPDVLCDPEGTIVRSLPVLRCLRQYGWKAAFVAQDGVTVETLPWPEFDVLFLGGSHTWDISHDAEVLVHEARRLGMWVHNGGVNSWRRYQRSQAMGCNSVDGTHLAFRLRSCNQGDRISGVDEIRGWVDRGVSSPPLPFWEMGGRE